MDVDLLITRPDDLFVVGVRLHDVSVAGGVATAQGPDSRVVLLLPPQHLLEETIAGQPAADAVVRAELGGPSRLAFSLAVGTAVPLTADGILAACHLLAGSGTTVELPARLAWTPAGTDGVRVDHPTAPVTAGTLVGAWLTRLAAVTGHALRMTDLDPVLARSADPFVPPLDATHRGVVADLAAGSAPEVSRLELGALGGSLTASSAGGGVEWSHRATHGRDQAVRVDERVLLYPFGFEAVLTTLTDRDPTVAGSGVPPGGPAVLRRTRTLRITRDRIGAADGGVLARTFPFDRVELLATSIGPLGQAQPSYEIRRQVPDVAALQQQLAEVRARLATDHDVWGPYVEGQHRTYEDLLRRGDGTATTYQSVDAGLQEWLSAAESIAGSDAQRDAALAGVDGWEAELASLSPGFEGPDGPDPTIQTRIAELNASIEAARDEAAQYFVDPGWRLQVQDQVRSRSADRDAWWARVEQAAAEQYRDLWDAVNLGDADPWVSGAAARTAEDLGTEATLVAQLGELDVLDDPTTVTEWPTTPTGARLLFPVRLARGDQVLDVHMPLIAVHDLVLPEAPQWGLSEYHSLTDPELPGALDDAWAGVTADDQETTLADDGPPASVVEVGGRVLDLVGAAVPQPGDLQVVRSLNIVAASRGTLFSPSLGRLAEAAEAAGRARWAMVVDLPALQRLGAGVPGVDSSAVVGFARDYLERGEGAQALLETFGPLRADFTAAADRTGGLAAVALAADAISRADGPVKLAALLADPDPAAIIDEAATLFGFSLQDLLTAALEAGPNPPALRPPQVVADATAAAGQVQSLADAQVRLRWTAPLGDVAAFRTNGRPLEDPARTHLELDVVADVHGTVTDCVVNDVALQFPFDEPLVKVSFTEVRFTQRTTHGVGPGATVHASAAPPKVTFTGFDLELLGALDLLERLQDAVDLSPGPHLAVTERGVTASLALPVPDVRCGVFALSNLDFHSRVEVPFDGRPVTVAFGFASRARPFALSVLAFSGGGYVDVVIDAAGPRIAAALEFGAQIAVDFVVASGEVHAFGGVEYQQQGSLVHVSGYLRLGGSLEVLGLVSVSLELRIALAYDSAGPGGRPRLVGRATLVLAIDLTFWSDQVEIDSGEWVLVGGGDPVAGVAPDSVAGSPPLDLPEDTFAALDDPVDDAELAAWQNYRAAVPA